MTRVQQHRVRRIDGVVSTDDILALPAIEADTSGLAEGALLTVDLASGVLTSDGATVRFPPVSDFFLRMVECGGLLNQVKSDTAGARA